MSKLGRAGILVAALCMAAGAWAKPAMPLSHDRRDRLMLEMGEAYEKHDCDAAMRVGKVLVAEPGLPDALAGPVYAILALCEIEKGSKDEAYAHILRATQFDQSPDPFWEIRFALEV